MATQKDIDTAVAQLQTELESPAFAAALDKIEAEVAKPTLGDLSVDELLAGASREIVGLGQALDKVALSADDRLLLNAYCGSIGARVAVARDKLTK